MKKILCPTCLGSADVLIFKSLSNEGIPIPCQTCDSTGWIEVSDEYFFNMSLKKYGETIDERPGNP